MVTVLQEEEDRLGTETGTTRTATIPPGRELHRPYPLDHPDSPNLQRHHEQRTPGSTIHQRPRAHVDQLHQPSISFEYPPRPTHDNDHVHDDNYHHDPYSGQREPRYLDPIGPTQSPSLDSDSQTSFASFSQRISDPSVASSTFAGSDCHTEDFAGSHALATVTSDDFCSNSASAVSFRDTTLPTADSEYMATPATTAPRARDNSALRPGGSGSSPKHPSSHAQRTPLGPSTRSVSAPIDTTTARLNRSRQPSVKDLTKRFDSHTATAIPRLPVRTGIPSRPSRSATNEDGVAPTSPQSNAQLSYSTLRASADPNLTPDLNRSHASTRTTQRTMYAAEDQVSNNSQSFASRISKPRNMAPVSAHTSKPTTYLPYKTSPQPPLPPLPPIASHPAQSRSQALLFGEILPEQRNDQTAGHGIQGSGTRPRRTSESNVQSAKSLHQRTLSDTDLAEPSSPTDWYRITNTAPVPATPQTNAHARTRSDNSVPITRKQVAVHDSADRLQPETSTSKLPISIRRLASPTPSNSTSSPSGDNSRAASPSHIKKSTTNGRTSRTGNIPTARSKTPTQTAANKRATPTGLVLPGDAARLDALLAATTPKLSPPLRSSRPRQSVATATTTSSRMRVTDGTKSYLQNPARKGSRPSEPLARRQKMAIGPVDFEQRREHIRLAYSKSIRESQATEARRKASEKRKKELEAAARAKAQALAASQVKDTPTTTQNPSPVLDQSRQQASSEVLGVDETVSHILLPVDGPHDSPTLGIPGSFPAFSPLQETEEIPQSAVSDTTQFTEFDPEPQTEPPTEVEAKSESSLAGLGLGLQDHSDEKSELPMGKETVEESENASLRVSGFSDPSTANLMVENHTFDQTQLPTDGGSTLIKISLEQSSPLKPERGRSQPLPSSSSKPGGIGMATLGNSLEEYEPLPYSSPSLETTIKILRRESDHSEFRPETANSPRLDDYDDADYEPNLDRREVRAFRRFASELGLDTTTTQPSSDGVGYATSDALSPTSLQHTIVSQQASVSEPALVRDSQPSSWDVQQHNSNAPHALTVPSALTSTNRSSQQSVWTDFSIDSNNAADNTSRTVGSRNSESLRFSASTFAADGEYLPSRTSSGVQEGGYAHNGSFRESVESQPFPYTGNNQLPEIDAGEGLLIPYLSQRASQGSAYEVPLPNYDPPPVPTPRSGSVADSRRPPSSAYQTDTRPGSTLIDTSRRPSDEFAYPLPGSQSVDYTSLDTRDPSLGGQTLADSDQKSLQASESGRELNEPDAKERHRLVQRRNVIKELIDTEMVFVRDMNIVEEIYKGTAEACPKLDDKIIKTVFRNVDEIVVFHTAFCLQLKEAVATVYAPQGRRSPHPREESIKSDSTGSNSATKPDDVNDTKDRATSIGPLFEQNMDKMKVAYEGFLRNSDQAAKTLIQIQQDPTVMVWLNECHEVAKDLTAAWDLDSLLIKPMQRITKYPNLIMTLLQHTPQDHPDRLTLLSAKEALETTIIEINKTKKNFELVGQIVGRKRKESDVKAGFARAFGKRVDRLQATTAKIPEDAVYAKLHEKFGDDYLRLQVVLRDVEFYTRQVSAYVHEFLQYLSSMELVMRLQPGSYPELESKWVQFNVSMRDIEKVALDQHLAQVRKHVIEPFEQVIKAYGNPSLAMKKRAKRRLDYEKAEQLKKSGKSLDAKLKELVEQYDALNETLKKELPILSTLTEKVGNICLGNFVNIQANWFSIWKDKVKVVLGDASEMPQPDEIVSTFQRDYKFAREQLQTIGILDPDYKGRASQSTITTRASTDDSSSKMRHRPPELSPRDRGRSLTSEQAPTLPAPDFGKRHSGPLSTSASATIPSPNQYYYKDYYSGIHGSRSSGPSGVATPLTAEPSPTTRTMHPPLSRSGTGATYDTNGITRQSSDSNVHHRRDSASAYGSGHTASEPKRYSGLFQSALPMTDTAEENQRSSRASSRERRATAPGYNVLWLAASLFEFNIETTKHEAGYPYLTYQAGEIFDVVAEKGELWLAKNQDDPTDKVGWIWSKHFAKLADS